MRSLPEIVKMNDAEAAKWDSLPPPPDDALPGAIFALQSALNEARESPIETVGYLVPALSIQEARALLIECEALKP